MNHPNSPASSPTTPPRSVTAPEAERLVKEGKAVLIDVREPKEWAGGVAAPAHLLSIGDLKAKSDSWKAFLKQHADKELILYCQAGGRAGTAAGLLAADGLRTANLGGLSSWRAAGLPVRQP